VEKSLVKRVVNAVHGLENNVASWLQESIKTNQV